MISSIHQNRLLSLSNKLENNSINKNVFLQNLFDIQVSIIEEMQKIKEKIKGCEKNIQKYNEDRIFIQNEQNELDKYTKEQLEEKSINHNVALRKLILYLKKSGMDEEELLNEETKKNMEKLQNEYVNMENILETVNSTILIFYF